MKAVVSQEECTGCEACVGICSDVFKMNDDGKAIAYVNPIPKEVQEDCREAADACPVEAITIEE